MLTFKKLIKGFSLIELLITIALIAFIAFMALPMTAAWIDGPDVTKGSTQFQQAFAKAKNIALREGATLDADKPAAVICTTKTNDVISVEVKSQTGVVGDTDRKPPNCTDEGREVFSTTLPREVTIKLGANDFSCACLGRNSTLLSSGACNGCITATALSANSFTISKGGESETVALY